MKRVESSLSLSQSLYLYLSLSLSLSLNVKQFCCITADESGMAKAFIFFNLQ